MVNKGFHNKMRATRSLDSYTTIEARQYNYILVHLYSPYMHGRKNVNNVGNSSD